jgi:hypothetical protein
VVRLSELIFSDNYFLIIQDDSVWPGFGRKTIRFPHIKDSQGSLGNVYSEHVLQAGSSNPISWWLNLPGKILN